MVKGLGLRLQTVKPALFVDSEPQGYTQRVNQLQGKWRGDKGHSLLGHRFLMNCSKVFLNPNL